VWTVELTKQQIVDCILDSLNMYSIWRPQIGWTACQLRRDSTSYLIGVDVGQGVVRVDFVETRPAPTEIFYGNLISPAPVMVRGMDDYDTFLRWRSTWMRVTSIKPDWTYDDIEGCLRIHNPIEKYTAGIQCYYSYSETSWLDDYGAVWVKDMALEKSRYLYGEIIMKYSGSLPGPAKDIQMDQQKRQIAQERMDKLTAQLQGAQISTPAQTD